MKANLKTSLKVGDIYTETTEYGKYRCRITKIDTKKQTINSDYLTSQNKPFCSVANMPFSFFEKDNIVFSEKKRKENYMIYWWNIRL